MIGALVGFLAAHLAAGSLLVSAFLSFANPLPTSFLRFCAMASAISAAGASIVSSGGTMAARVALAGAGLLWFLLLRGKGRHRAAPVLAGLAGLAALGFECASPRAGAFLCVAGALSSALLLGSVSVSMVLGHWYLVDPGLPITPLKRSALCFAAMVGARWLVVGSALAGDGQAVLGVERAADFIYSTPALFFLIRALTGLGGPLLLAGLVWQTVRMRSTQSATGLLYVALFLVLFGELISQFLTLETGLPL